jgi:hypothetical protein
MKERLCIFCKTKLTKRHQIKYCSNKCQWDYQQSNWVESWKSGQQDGNRGINTRNISCHLKRYLFEKYGNKCFDCGWNKKHPITGVIPLEIEHIDGDSENNKEENLKLLCPNCHALTIHYKNLNKGNGRKWRMKKYIKNISAA